MKSYAFPGATQPSSQYGAPSVGQSSGFGRPSQSYGAPNQGRYWNQNNINSLSSFIWNICHITAYKIRIHYLHDSFVFFLQNIEIFEYEFFHCSNNKKI